MKRDEERIDRAILALLYLGLHEDNRAWEGSDWNAMNRLHEKDYISDPVGQSQVRCLHARWFERDRTSCFGTLAAK